MILIIPFSDITFGSDGKFCITLEESDFDCGLDGCFEFLATAIFSNGNDIETQMSPSIIPGPDNDLCLDNKSDDCYDDCTTYTVAYECKDCTCDDEFVTLTLLDENGQIVDPNQISFTWTINGSDMFQNVNPLTVAYTGPTLYDVNGIDVDQLCLINVEGLAFCRGDCPIVGFETCSGNENIPGYEDCQQILGATFW